MIPITATPMVRVTTLTGIEQGILALYGCTASIAWLCLGLPGVPMDFTPPWAVIPLPAFAAAFWLAPATGPGWPGGPAGPGRVQLRDERRRAHRRLLHRDGVHPPDRPASRVGNAEADPAADDPGQRGTAGQPARAARDNRADRDNQAGRAGKCH